MSYEDVHPHHFADSLSRDREVGYPGGLGNPAARAAAVHQGALSEPVKRAHRAQVQDPPEARWGVFSRASSTVSRAAAVETRPGDSERRDTLSPSQRLRPDPADLVITQGSTPPPRAPEEPPLDPSKEIWIPHERNPAETPALTGLGEGPEPGGHRALEPELTAESRSAGGFLQPQHGGERPLPLNPFVTPPPPPPTSAPLPPSSPARARRTLEGPPKQRPPSPPIRTKGRSQSCPRRRTPLPHAHAPAVHWPNSPEEEEFGGYRDPVRPVQNGLCLSGSASSSSSDEASVDGLELVPSCLPAGREQPQQRGGTLQREMNALFDQKMKEIRCTSPIFFSEDL